jgi:pimeloyl-ACP methyl ester carboxylesterase
VITQRDGHDIHYEVHGAEDAPTLLLVMGLGLSSRSWDLLPGILSTRFRVIVFDNRGTGRSTRKAGLPTMATFADDAAAVLRAASVTEEEPAFVFGISLGGMIAQELVLRHPKLVKALALGATHAGFLRARWPSLSSMIGFLALITLGPGKNGARLARLTVSPAFHASSVTDFERWMAAMDARSPLVNLMQLGAVFRHSAHKRLRTLQLPTLLLSGDRDLIIPIENARALRELIPGAKLEVLEGAGHVFPLEQPQATVMALANHFLGGTA